MTTQEVDSKSLDGLKIRVNAVTQPFRRATIVWPGLSDPARLTFFLRFMTKCRKMFGGWIRADVQTDGSIILSYESAETTALIGIVRRACQRATQVA